MSAESLFLDIWYLCMNGYQIFWSSADSFLHGSSFIIELNALYFNIKVCKKWAWQLHNFSQNYFIAGGKRPVKLMGQFSNLNLTKSFLFLLCQLTTWVMNFKWWICSKNGQSSFNRFFFLWIFLRLFVSSFQQFCTCS